MIVLSYHRRGFEWECRLEKDEDPEPSGIGGWLILVMLSQILAPVITIGFFWRDSLYYSRILDMPGGTVAACGGVFLNIFVLAIQITTLVLMYRTSRLFPHWFTFQGCVMAVHAVAYWLFLSWSLNIQFDRLVEPEDAKAAYSVIVSVVIWIIYIHRSVRVRNTFVD